MQLSQLLARIASLLEQDSALYRNTLWRHGGHPSVPRTAELCHVTDALNLIGAQVAAFPSPINAQSSAANELNANEQRGDDQPMTDEEEDAAKQINRSMNGDRVRLVSRLVLFWGFVGSVLPCLVMTSVISLTSSTSYC